MIAALTAIALASVIVAMLALGAAAVFVAVCVYRRGGSIVRSAATAEEKLKALEPRLTARIDQATAAAKAAFEAAQNRNARGE